MPIFKINKDNLTPVKEVNIKLEKDLQNITENNLKVVFGLDFVSSEFALHNFRIDTLWEVPIFLDTLSMGQLILPAV